MNRRVLLLTLLLLSLGRVVAEEATVVPTPPVVVAPTVDAYPVLPKDVLKDLILNRENRKAELDKITAMVDASITVQMKEVIKLLGEIKETRATVFKIVSDKLKIITGIIAGMESVDFRISAIYPEQLKTIQNVITYLDTTK